MNIEEYISSGILESYVLGALDVKEAESVEEMAASHPIIAEELSNIQRAMEGYAMAHAITPPAHVKKKLFAEIENSEPSPIQSEKTVEFPSSTSNKSMQWLVAASVTAAVLSTGSSIYFWNQWRNTEVQLVSLQQENQRFAYKANQTIQLKEKQLRENAEYFSFVKDTSTTRVAMKGVAVSPSSIALVFWNKASNEVYLDIQNLPAAPSGMQYQLWALDNGVPIDAGIFAADVNGNLQKMKHIKSAQAFAVTLEKAGGSTTPTLESLYVIGTI